MIQKKLERDSNFSRLDRKLSERTLRPCGCRRAGGCDGDEAGGGTETVFGHQDKDGLKKSASAFFDYAGGAAAGIYRQITMENA